MISTLQWCPPTETSRIHSLAHQDVLLFDAQYLAALVQLGFAQRALALEVAWNEKRKRSGDGEGQDAQGCPGAHLGTGPRPDVTDGQAHQVQLYVFHFGQLLYGRTEEHALVVRMSGDQQHPVRVVLQLQHHLFASRPQAGPHVSGNEHRRRHEHGRVQVDHFEYVLMEYLEHHDIRGV